MDSILRVYDFFTDLFISLGSTTWLYDTTVLGFSIFSFLGLAGLTAYLGVAITKWIGF